MRTTTAVLLAAAIVCNLADDRPHIIMFLVDDYGWANVGYHRSAQDDPHYEVQTPNIDELVANGIELDRAYSYKFCSPTRSSLQSGRLPVHVNDVNIKVNYWNPKDPVSGFQGIPRNMTGMATVMQQAGYSTHQIGKWDAGMATPDHTPQGRGYDTSFGYFHHTNDYWTQQAGDYLDLWFNDHPAFGFNGTQPVESPLGPEEDYEEYKFAQRAYTVLNEWEPSHGPLFLNYDFHVAHDPMESPTEYFKQFDFMTNDYGSVGHRQLYTSMVHYMDTVIGNMTRILKDRGMWENTLIALQSDNGGPSFEGSNHTANNWPLRGSKLNNFEGGVRVNAFIAGGYLEKVAPNQVGKKLEGLTHVCDFYATFAHLAGVNDPVDRRAEEAGLPPLDSLNLWPYLSGQNDTSPRDVIHMDTNAAISGQYKVLTGLLTGGCWSSPVYPNGTSNPACPDLLDCGDDGCLFNIFEDPGEHHNLAEEQPEKLQEMIQLLAQLNQTYFNPQRLGGDPNLAKRVARDKYSGFWGPFLP